METGHETVSFTIRLGDYSVESVIFALEYI